MTTPPRPAGWAEIDWSRPWLAPWRRRGVPLAAEASRIGLVAALNAAVASAVAGALGAEDATADMAGPDPAPADALCLRAGRLHFVAQHELPAREAYEAFIARTASVPTRENLHDFFNGLAWLSHFRLKRRLNELHAEEVARGAPSGRRGPLGDALTLFDENAALLQGPPGLVEALRQRDWHSLFVTRRAVWAEARVELFGHALLEKLVRPRRAITAHVWLVPPAGGSMPDRAADVLEPRQLEAKPFLPLPVLGIPGWWPLNEAAGFYGDETVFRPARATGTG